MRAWSRLEKPFLLAQKIYQEFAYFHIKFNITFHTSMDRRLSFTSRIGTNGNTWDTNQSYRLMWLVPEPRALIEQNCSWPFDSHQFPLGIYTRDTAGILRSQIAWSLGSSLFSTPDWVSRLAVAATTEKREARMTLGTHPTQHLIERNPVCMDLGQSMNPLYQTSSTVH